MTKPTLISLYSGCGGSALGFKNAGCEIDFMIEYRDQIIKCVFKGLENNKIHLPVSFKNIIDNIQAQSYITKHSITDITIL